MFLRRFDPVLLLCQIVKRPIGLAQPGFCWTVVRVQLERLLEEGFGAGQRFSLRPKISLALQEVVICLRDGGGVCCQGLPSPLCAEKYAAHWRCCWSACLRR